MKRASNDFEFPSDPEEFTKARINIQAESIFRLLLWAAFLPLCSTIKSPIIWRLDSDDIRQALDEGRVDFGVAFAGARESVAAGELVGTVDWIALAPAGHRLDADGPVSVEDLPVNEWLFLSGGAGDDLVELFAKAGKRQIMATDHLVSYVAARNIGVAVLPDVLGSRCPRGTIKRRFHGLPPVQVRLFLPRGGEAALCSQGKALLRNLRGLVRDGFFGNSEAPAAAKGLGNEAMLSVKTAVEVVEETSIEEPSRTLEGVVS
jgi:DNA-binding transcriptional LysR family regulator